MLPSLDFLTSALVPPRGLGAVQALSTGTPRPGWEGLGLIVEVWRGSGGFTTRVRAWPAASSPLRHSGCRGRCSGVGPLWLVPSGVKLFMIHVLP